MVLPLLDPDWYFDNVLYYSRPGVRPKVMSDGPIDWARWWRTAAASDDDLVRWASEQGFVLTAAQCIDRGVSRARRRNETAQGRWTDAGYDAVGPLDVRDPELTARGRARERRRRHALVTAGECLHRTASRASARSAAILHGLPTLGVPARPDLTEAGSGDGRRSSTHLYRAGLADAETTSWYGVPVETAGRTLVSLARHGRRDAIMAADAALREGLVDRDDIDRALRSAVGWPWVRQARAVLALADRRAESPLESLVRLALHDSGFPDPVLQYWLGPDRVDLYWPKYRLVLEADGDLKYVGDASLREKQRERRLRRRPDVRGVERVGWSDVLDGWESFSRDLQTWFR